MFRLPKWTALVAGVGFGIGLVWLCPPIAPRYTASARVATPLPNPVDPNLEDWSRSAIQSRATSRSAPVGLRFLRPNGREHELEIAVLSRDRKFALDVVTDLVDHIRETGTSHVLAEPAVDWLPFPSFTSVLIGVFTGLLAGAAFYHRLNRPTSEPEF